MVHGVRAKGGRQCNCVCVCVFMLRRAMVLKRAALLGLRGFNYRLWEGVQVCVCVLGGEGVNTEIKRPELNGLLADKMKESDNEDWAET